MHGENERARSRRSRSGGSALPSSRLAFVAPVGESRYDDRLRGAIPGVDTDTCTTSHRFDDAAREESPMTPDSEEERDVTSAAPSFDPVAKAALVTIASILVLTVILVFLPRSVAFPFPAPLDEPRSWPIALFLAAIPGLFAYSLVSRWREARRASTWPEARARVTRSTVAVEHRRRTREALLVFNQPAVEYEFMVGAKKFRGRRIGIGDPPNDAVRIAALLARFPVGADVPVFYDPRDPADALLARELPAEERRKWIFVLLLAAICTALGLLALRAEAIMEWLQPRFPDGAQPQAAIFFALVAFVMLAILIANRRSAIKAARWPIVRGRIVRSSVDSYKARVGGARTGSLVTMHQAVTEYAYIIDGREFASTQTSFGATVASMDKSIAESRAARYTEGQEVDVHYDPENATNAVIESKVAFAWPSFVLALVFLGLALFFGGAFR